MFSEVLITKWKKNLELKFHFTHFFPVTSSPSCCLFSKNNKNDSHCSQCLLGIDTDLSHCFWLAISGNDRIHTVPLNNPQNVLCSLYCCVSTSNRDITHSLRGRAQIRPGHRNRVQRFINPGGATPRRGQTGLSFASLQSLRHFTGLLIKVQQLYISPCITRLLCLCCPSLAMMFLLLSKWNFVHCKSGVIMNILDTRERITSCYYFSPEMSQWLILPGP